ncbi:hypothetical protein CD798_12730 [Bacillaceae bacterium SAOS 7]|nr:hypothetical protein CD798_12730 [Bacillaceae bacterium SAOS 7]
MVTLYLLSFIRTKVFVFSIIKDFLNWKKIQLLNFDECKFIGLSYKTYTFLVYHSEKFLKNS